MNDLPREKLYEIIAKHGTSLCDEPQRLEGLLRDLCPANRREVNVLISALKAHVATDLITSSAVVPVELTIARLARRLQDDQGLTEETAHWAVETWALALRKISDDQVLKSKSSIPQKSLAETWTEPEDSFVPRSTVIQPAIAPGRQRSTHRAKKNKILITTGIAAIIVLGGLIYLVVRPAQQPTPTPSVMTTPSPSQIVKAVPSSMPSLEPSIQASPQSPPPASTPVTYSPPPTPAVLVSQGEAETFINSFYRSLEQNDPNAILSYFDDSVDFLDYGRRDKTFIADDYRKYFEVSPARSYSVGAIRLDNSPTQNTATASFEVRYTVENPARHKLKTGRAQQRWVLAKSDGVLKIIDIKETVYPDSSVPITASAETSHSSTDDSDVIRDFINGYYTALSRHDLDSIMSKFAETVYYDGKQRDKRYIRRDIASYLQKYDTLTFDVEQPIDVSRAGSREFNASFSIRYNLSGRGAHPHGVSTNRWALQSDANGNLRILSQRETVYRGR
jgi:hypothetical protein